MCLPRDGRYRNSIGRQGKGPGEFSNIGAGIKVRGDTLYALQSRQRQIDLFNRISGDHIRSISIPEAEVDGSSLGSPQAIFPQRDGGFLVYLMAPYFFPPEEGADQKFTTVAQMDASGNFIKKKIYQTPSLYPSQKRLIYQDGQSFHVFVVYIYPSYVIAAGSDGSFYHAKTDSLHITRFDMQGHIEQDFNAGYERLEFTNEDLQEMVNKYNEVLGKAIMDTGKPDYLPSFDTMLIDDEGRVWVQLLRPDQEAHTWRIFNEEGNMAWEASLPKEVELYDVAGGKAYGIENNQESLPAIHRYDIEF